MPTFPSIEEQLTQIRRGVEDIIPEDALVEKLKTSKESGKPLIVVGWKTSSPKTRSSKS